ncbi:MAG TPA: MFS transporter [Fibrobacteria bacterium]|nr:MFS transporter [Fibrobacteria bacterium]
MPEDSPARSGPAGRFHYAWVAAGVTFLVLLSTAAVRSSPSIMMVPWEEEFHWSRATVSLAASINILLFGLMGPFAAGFIKAFGARRVILCSLTVTGLGALASLWMESPYALVATWGIVVGAGTGMATVVLGASVVNTWFHSKRGVVLGALTGANATGQLLFLPAMAYIVSHQGWRYTVSAVLLYLILLVPLVRFLMRNRPEDVGLRPYGWPKERPPASPPASRVQANPFAETVQGLRIGLRSREFWLLAGSFFICGASTNGLVGTHLVPACMDHGIPEVKAAGLLAIMGIFDLLGTTGSGWLSDRFDNRKLLFMYYALRGLALIYLPHGFRHSETGLSIFAVFYGLDWIATVPPTLGLAAQAFGRDRAAIMFGWIMVAHQIGASLAAYLAGFFRTREGNYDHAFLAAGLLCVLTAFAVLRIGRRPEPALAIR